LAQVLLTSITTSFLPFRTALLISTEKGAVHATPQFIPFTITSAMFATFPTFSNTFPPFDACCHWKELE
jgi:hypothetical protein